jgi:hypothetical protein
MYDSKSNVGSVYGVFGGILWIVLSVSGMVCEYVRKMFLLGLKDVLKRFV